MGVKFFVSKVGDQVRPFLFDPPGLIFVVQDRGGKGAGNGEEYHPVAGREAEARKAWDSSALFLLLSIYLHVSPIILKAGLPSAAFAAFAADPAEEAFPAVLGAAFDSDAALAAFSAGGGGFESDMLQYWSLRESSEACDRPGESLGEINCVDGTFRFPRPNQPFLLSR